MEYVFIFLAQSSDTNADQVFTRIVIAFCALAIVWLALMGATAYRGIENRRRKAQGIEPLPPIWTWTYHMILRVVNSDALPESAKQRPKTKMDDSQPVRVSTWDPDMPAPDLDMLMGEFGTPEPVDHSAAQNVDQDDDLSLDFDIVPEPAHTVPVEAATSSPTSDLTEGELADEFSLDGDEPESAPVENAAEPDSAPESEKESAPESEEESESKPEPELEEPAMSAPPDTVEVLRVWRDISDGTLILEVNGRRFSSMPDLRSAELERRFMNVVKELVALIKAGQGAAPKAQPSSQPQPQSSPRQPKPRPVAASTSVEADEAAAQTPRKLSTEEMPSMAPSDMFRQMGQLALGRKQESPEEEPVVVESLSIPEQIDALLQQRLQTLPEFVGREIEVQPSLGGLVIIKVDGKFYEGVGEVADDDVRALLQDVVREWEESQ